MVRHGKSMRTRLEKVLKRLSEYNFKCAFALDKVVFLGHLITYEGVSPSPILIQSIVEFPIPQDKTAVRSFLGLVNFYRKYVSDYARIGKPLFELTKDDIEFHFDEKELSAFNTLKNCLIERPVLAHFDEKLETELRTDASLIGLGAVLVQKHDKGFKPVGYYSRLIRGSECNYGIYDLEILALTESLKFFRDMLHGIRFVHVCDNRAVSFIKSKKDLRGRLARAAMQMEEFDFRIEFRPSHRNKDSDALSRYPIGYKIINDKILNNELKELNANNIDKYVANYVKICGIEENSNKIEVNIGTIHRSSENKIAIEQRNDSELKPIIDSIENRNEVIVNNRNIYEQYFLDNGILYKVKNSNKGEKLLLCIPKCMRLGILEKYHDLNSSSHLGIKRTIAKLNERFYWKNMTNFIKGFIKSCHTCQLRKKPKMKPNGFLQPIITDMPFQQIAIDHVGEFVKSKSGNKYVIVVTDTFSKYAICKAVRRSDAENVAKFLFNDIICIYGAPQRILSDRAQCFLGKLIRELNKLMGIEQRMTSGLRYKWLGMNRDLMAL